MSDDDPFASWAEQLADIEIPKVDDFKSLSDAQLALRLNEIEEELAELNELHHPRTEAGRELHSLRGAIKVEMHNPERMKRGC